MKIGDLITKRTVNGLFTFKYPVEVNENGEGSVSVHVDDKFAEIKFIRHKRIQDVEGFVIIRRYKDYNNIIIKPLKGGEFYENDDYHLLKIYYYYDKSLEDYFIEEHPEYQELIKFEKKEGSRQTKREALAEFLRKRQLKEANNIARLSIFQRSKL